MHIQVQGKSFIIDTGPDFRQQILRAGIKRVDAVLFTHEHKDHTAGLDDIRGFNFAQQSAIPLYARAQVIDQLKREFAYAFDENKYPGVPEIDVYELDGQPFSVQGVQVTPIFVKHYFLDVLGFRFGDFTYITDANFNALRKTPHISHFTLDEALAVIAQVQPEQAYITHISHMMGLHAAVQQELPPNVFLAYDGLSLSL
jgi:phosphoribosyl 1,2-cyclic phosphate phosphodiesterase